MTATASTNPAAGHRHLPVPDRWTTAGAVVGLGCTLAGSYLETPWKSGPGDWGVGFAANGGWTTLAVLLAFAATALVVVGMAARRARDLPPERAARRALLFAGLGVVALVVFWTGIPPVLAAAAAGLALDARSRQARMPAAAAVAVCVAILVGAAAIYLAFTG
jgi:hypothetical protein